MIYIQQWISDSFAAKVIFCILSIMCLGWYISSHEYDKSSFAATMIFLLSVLSSVFGFFFFFYQKVHCSMFTLPFVFVPMLKDQYLPLQLIEGLKSTSLKNAYMSLLFHNFVILIFYGFLKPNFFGEFLKPYLNIWTDIYCCIIHI